MNLSTNPELPGLYSDLPITSDDPDVRKLVEWLAAGPKRWSTSTQIKDALGYCDRTTRRLAALSAGLILSGPGSPGYIYIRKASADDVRRVCDKLTKQAENMTNRAREIRHQAHALIS